MLKGSIFKLFNSKLLDWLNKINKKKQSPWPSNLTKLLVFVLLFIAVVTYQNCSPVHFNQSADCPPDKINTIIAGETQCAEPPNPSPSPTSTTTPTPTPTPPPVCEKNDVLKATRSYFESVEVDSDLVAKNCVDKAYTGELDSLPLASDDFRSIRYFNSCGNRYCKDIVKALEGRVVSYTPASSPTTLSITKLNCRKIEPPPNITSACQTRIDLLDKPLVVLQNVNLVKYAETCKDNFYQNPDDSNPAIIASNSRLFLRAIHICGTRYCQSLNKPIDPKSSKFTSGRMTEIDGKNNILDVVCYREEIFNDLNDNETVVEEIPSKVEDVAYACRDDSGPFETAIANYPKDVETIIRFMNTCTEKFCMKQTDQQNKSKGYKTGTFIDIEAKMDDIKPNSIVKILCAK